MTVATLTRPTSTSLATGGGLLEIDPSLFAGRFSREPFTIGHDLGEHPLFQVDRILELAKALPAECIEYNAGTIPVVVDSAETPQNGLSAGETIRRIAECKSWMVLKYVERDPAYAQLLEQCLAEVRKHSEAITPGMTQPQAFIFLTSPGSVTPYHIDPEHNFLLQIQGSKTVRMFDGRDRSILSEEHLEQFYADRGRNLVISEDDLERCWTFDLTPGQGLHFPVTYPHWVKNGDAVSISFSITFRTPDLDRRRSLYRANDWLRQRGRTPSPVGHNDLRDSVVYNAMRIVRRASTPWGR